jgi:hypothetical protein
MWDASNTASLHSSKPNSIHLVAITYLLVPRNCLGSHNTVTTQSIMTSHGEWRTDDLCTQCHGFPFEDEIHHHESPKPLRKRLNIIYGSKCPLCRFFDATLHTREASTMVTNTVVFLLERSRSSMPNNNEINFNSETEQKILLIQEHGGEDSQIRFLIPLPSDQGKGRLSSRWLKEKLQHKSYRKTPTSYRRPQKNVIDIDFLKRCIHGCQADHADLCPEPNRELLLSIVSSPGFRLIDCSTTRITLAPKVPEYVALSYVWGRAPTVHVDETGVYGEAENKLPSDFQTQSKTL